ncbi:unnamed protein product, partial [Prorocentrum cordatum]
SCSSSSSSSSSSASRSPREPRGGHAPGAVRVAGSRGAETRASAGAMSGQLPDYDLEARKLFELLNLPASGAASAASSAAHRYRDLDAVWEHPRTGARVFIGAMPTPARASRPCRSTASPAS